MHAFQKMLAVATLFTSAFAAHADCTIYVSHNNEGSGPFWQFASGSNNEMWLREAAEVGRGDNRCYTDFEKDRIIGGNFINDPVFCGTPNNTRNWRLNPVNPGCGPNQADTIRFWDDINGGATINLNSVVTLDRRDSIDGAPIKSFARPPILLQGAGSAGNSGALLFDTFPESASGAVRNLVIDNFRGYGIAARHVSGLSIKGVTVSRISADSLGFAYGLSLGEYTGPVINGRCVRDAQIGGTGSGEQNYFYDIAYIAISLWDTCADDSSDRNNKIFNNYVGLCAELDTGTGLEGCAGFPNAAIAQRGISIIDTPNTRIGGTGSNERNVIVRSGVAGIHISGAHSRDTRVYNNLIGQVPTGLAGRGNAVGVRIAFGAYQNQIGGANSNEGNVISSNTQHGVQIESGDGNSVRNNIIGLNAARNQARGNGIDGVSINASSNGTVVSANVIAHNAGQGVYIDGGSGHTISGNVIGLRGFANNSNDNTAAPNANGIWINGIAGNTISGNRIAGNSGFGLWISGEGADGNSVRGNVIGLSSGNDRRPNSVGVYIEAGADSTVVGGANLADRNIISGNTFEGVRITGDSISGTIVRGNYVGTIPSGLAAAPNASRGVRIDSGATTTEVTNNLISGNNVDGVALIGAGTGTKVQSNTIGLSANGSALPNTASGVAVTLGTMGALIGDTAAPNTIAANGSWGIFVANAGTDDNTLSGNLIGSSNSALANAAGGITLQGGVSGNILHGNTVLGHSGDPGIEIAGSSNNTVRNNLIGLNASSVIAANQVGVRLIAGATGNTIGGGIAEGNIISGNSAQGVRIADSGSNNNSVLNNRIGTDTLGTSARPNFIGVLIENGAANNGVTANLISGNTGEGVRIQGMGSNGNRVQRNRIGLTPTGTAVLPNGGDGVLIGGDAVNTIVGGLPAQANIIRGNTGTGVRVETGNGNDISFNSVFGNGRLGIDIGPFGLSSNDALDADSGGNDVLNFPVLSNVLQNGAMASMTLMQNGLPSKQHAVLVYANSVCDGSGSGEGETYLDTLAITTNATGSGAVSVMISLPSSAPVAAFSATANATTASGTGENTSEFSPCATTAPLPNAIFASGFEPTTAAPQIAKASTDANAVSDIVRLSEDQATLTLRFENRSAQTQPARSIELVSDRAVVIATINTDNAACDLLGAIVCELPMLEPGQQSRVVVQLGNARDALKMMVRERSGTGALKSQEFLLLPY